MRPWPFLAAVALSGCLALSTYQRSPCSTDADCTGGHICVLLSYSQVCAPPGYCEVDADCPASGATSGVFGCHGNRCGPSSCATDADCRSGYRCIGSACAAPCKSDAQCATGNHCSAGACACLTDADCSPYVCAGICGTTCLADSACASSFACNNQKCTVRSCTVGQPGQCGGFACGVGGACKSSCTTASDCDDGLACLTSGVCGCNETHVTCPFNFRCVGGACPTTCTSNADCLPGLTCAAGSCGVCGGTPLPCEQQPQCGIVQGCSGEGDFCTGTPAPCEQAAEAYCEDTVGCTLQ